MQLGENQGLNPFSFAPGPYFPPPLPQESLLGVFSCTEALTALCIEFTVPFPALQNVWACRETCHFWEALPQIAVELKLCPSGFQPKEPCSARERGSDAKRQERVSLSLPNPPKLPIWLHIKMG